MGGVVLSLPMFMGSIHVGPAGMHGSLDMSDAQIDTIVTCVHQVEMQAERSKRNETASSQHRRRCHSNSNIIRRIALRMRR